MNPYRLFFVLFALMVSPLSASAAGDGECVSPLDYDIMAADDGIERFRALERCHKDAVKKNAPISYAGIKTLDIEIPAGAESIPLPDEVDFAGVRINVLNTQKDINLFVKMGSSSPVEVPKEAIDRGRFMERYIMRIALSRTSHLS